MAAVIIAAGFANARAGERGVLDYKVYFGGFAAAALEIDLARAAVDYRIAMKLRTLGVIDQFFPWTMQAYSRGLLNGADARPSSAGQTSDWRGRTRVVEVRYDGDRPVVRRLSPPSGEDDRAKVPDHEIAGTVDLASAILSMSLAAEAGRGCAGEMPVFDGRRRYDLVSERLGMERIRRFGYSGHETEALKCRVSMVRRSGFRKSRDRERSGAGSARRSALAWIARAGPAMPPLPVRIEVETRWGLLIAHLVRVRPTNAGEE